VSLRGKSGPALGGTEYRVPADAISVPADSASEIGKFTISIPRESCTNAKAKYSSSVVPPDPSVHFYHWYRCSIGRVYRKQTEFVQKYKQVEDTLVLVVIK